MVSQRAVRIEARRPTAGALLRDGRRRLLAAGLFSGARDAEVLLAHALGASRTQLIVGANEPVDDQHAAAYERLLCRRLQREPVAYITGLREFWSLEFVVTPAVLIPRPETELLAEVALEWARPRELHELPLRIADIGTGSGAIIVALATELSSASLTATDVSLQALAAAQINAANHRVADRIHFLESDLFSSLPERARFDLIVCNPPYIASDQIAGLDPDVSRWEPRVAFDGGSDGLDFYRRIAAEALPWLSFDGALLLEIGAETGAAVARIFHDAGGWDRVFIRRDYAGRERVAIARGHPSSR